MNDVKAGGATVFPEAKARVPVVKVRNSVIDTINTNVAFIMM